MSGRAHLSVVDTATGEIQEGCASCAALADQLAGAEKDVRAWRQRHANVVRDRESEARGSELWAEAEALFGYWKLRCNHPNSRFTVDRFDAILPYLKKFGPAICRRAIDGLAHDPFTTRRKNGTEKRHDGWVNILCKNADAFEECVNKAPRRAPTDPDPAELMAQRDFLAAGMLTDRSRLMACERPDQVAIVLLDQLRNIQSLWPLMRASWAYEGDA